MVGTSKLDPGGGHCSQDDIALLFCPHNTPEVVPHGTKDVRETHPPV